MEIFNIHIAFDDLALYVIGLLGIFIIYLLLSRNHILSYNTKLPTFNWDNEDDPFLNKVNSIIEKNIEDHKFGHSELEKALCMSRSKLYYKIKVITGLSVSLYIRKIRLNKAKNLLESTDYNMSEISILVGFDSLSHFSRYFKEEFGSCPSKFSH